MLYFRRICIFLLSFLGPFVYAEKDKEKNFDRTLLRPKNCPFEALGEKYEVDKVNPFHNYQLLYCEILQPFLRFKRYDNNPKPLMLEIGFGCGHHVHGASCILWNKLFNDHILYYSIDYTIPESKSVTCLKQFQDKHPTLLHKIWFGDQSDFNFLANVTKDLKQDNITFDFIVDDGGHAYHQQLATFLKLWPFIKPGGIYIVEDLAMDEGFTLLIMEWIRILGTGKETARRKKLDENQLSVDLLRKENMKQIPLPQGVSRIGCSFQICYLKKVFTRKELPKIWGLEE